MVDIFERAEALHNTRYVNYISDGDSKTYNKIVESVSYEVKKKSALITSKREWERGCVILKR